MKKMVMVCLVLGIAVSFVRVSHAWLVDTEVKTDVNNNSNNDNSNHDNDLWNSNNRYDIDNRRIDSSFRDNRSFSDRSIKDSYNTDNSAYQAVSGSYNGNTFENSAGKRIGSHDIGGNVSNSVVGDFNQRVGTDFSGGFQGSATTIEAAVTNTQTLGNVTVGGSGSSNELEK